MFSSRFDAIFTHKNFTWTDFGGIYTPYTPVAMALVEGSSHNATWFVRRAMKIQDFFKLYI